MRRASSREAGRSVATLNQNQTDCWRRTRQTGRRRTAAVGRRGAAAAAAGHHARGAQGPLARSPRNAPPAAACARPHAPAPTRLQAVSAFRPWLLHLLGRLVQRREEASAAGREPPRAAAGDSLSCDEDAAVALSFVLTLAPHTAPLVHRFFAAAGLPLARFDTLSCAELAAAPEAGWEHARTLSRAALRLAEAAAACGDGPLQRAVGAAACCSTALRLACHPDQHVRFAAARLAAAGLLASAPHAASMRRRCLTADEVRQC